MRFLAIPLCLTLLAPAAPALAASPLNLALVGRVDLSPGPEGYFDALFVHDDRVYFLERHDAGGGNFDSWLHIWDVGDPTDPRALSRAPFRGRISDMHGIYYSNGLLYFASQSAGGGLHIWDVRDSASLRPLGTADPLAPTLSYGLAGVHNLRKAGNFVYLLPNGDDPDLVVVDVSDPAAPTIVGEQNLHASPESGFIHDMSIVEHLGYASGWDDGVYIFDLSNPMASPLPLLQHGPTGENTHSAWPTPDGKHLLTCHERRNEPVRIWDTTASAFNLLGNYRSVEGGADNIVHDVMVIGRFAYISHYGEGFRILDLGDLSAPREVASWLSGPGCGAGYCDGIAQWVEDGLIYYLDMANGLYIFRFELPHDAPIRVLARKTAGGSDLELSWNHTGESQYSVRARLMKETLTGSATTDVDGQLRWTDPGAIERQPALVFYTLNGAWTGTP